MDYIKWHGIEPNNHGGDGEDCGGFYKGHNSGGWNDQRCKWQIAYLCGYRNLDDYDGPTFTFHEEMMNWHEARWECQMRGGDLASIHSDEENAEAFALAGTGNVWFGLND